MQKIIFILFPLLFLLVLIQTTYSSYPEYEDLYINDWANLLDKQTESSIRDKLAKLKRDAGVEITLVTIDNMSSYSDTQQSIEAFALDLFNRWGVGDAKRNDGVLVLISRFDRTMRIATGRAYDNTNMNVVAKSIIDEDFIPYFKRDQYQAGIEQGMNQVILEFDPNSSMGLGLFKRVTQGVKRTTGQAWHELISSEALLFIVFFLIVIFSGIVRFVKGKLSTGTVERYGLVKANYLVDEQPKAFTQKFADIKRVEAGKYIATAFGGGLLLSFFSIFVGFNFWKTSIVLYLLLIAAAYGFANVLMRRRNQPKECPRCQHAMERLSEAKDDARLLLPERVEESLKSVDYDVWVCAFCDRTKKLDYPYWLSSIKDCHQCSYKTLEIDVNVLRSATTSREGLEEVIEDCKYCDFHHEYERKIPRKSESNNSSGGSSFGGGSSSGGGASGSW